MWPLPPLIKEHQHSTYLREPECAPEHITRLLTLSSYYRTGCYEHDREAYRCLRFLRWLHRQGKIELEEGHPCLSLLR